MFFCCPAALSPRTGVEKAVGAVGSDLPTPGGQAAATASLTPLGERARGEGCVQVRDRGVGGSNLLVSLCNCPLSVPRRLILQQPTIVGRGYAARKLDQYAAQKVSHLRGGYSTPTEYLRSALLLR